MDDDREDGMNPYLEPAPHSDVVQPAERFGAPFSA